MKADMMTQVINNKGRAFNVRIVFKGDDYGLKDCLTHEENAPLVEFYDATYTEKFGARGQFVSRYYFDTLCDSETRIYGLNLCGGVDAWEVDADALNAAITWAESKIPAELRGLIEPFSF